MNSDMLCCVYLSIIMNAARSDYCVSRIDSESRSQQAGPMLIMPSAMRALRLSNWLGRSETLPIVVVSYCWLTAQHLDPKGKQLKIIVDALQAASRRCDIFLRIQRVFRI